MQARKEPQNLNGNGLADKIAKAFTTTTDGLVKTTATIATTCFIAFFALLACEGEEGRFLPTPSTASVDLLAIVSYSTTHRGITLYDTDGNLVRHLGNLRTNGAGIPRGIAFIGNDTLLVPTDAPDNIWSVNFDSSKAVYSGSSNFNGTIYGITLSLDQQFFYSLESNGLEKFNTASGLQVQNAYLPGGVGSCTISSPRAMVTSPEGYIVIANNGGSDAIIRIDDTGASPTCVSTQNFGGNPFGLLYHSNGTLYVSHQGDDAIYTADADGQNGVNWYDPGTAILNNPTGMVELPNGDILVASSATHTIERIDTNGVRVGTQPFISDVYSQTVYDIIYISADDL